MTDKQKVKEVTRLWCKWNRREMTAKELVYKIEELLKEEVLETWNDPLEKLLV